MYDTIRTVEHSSTVAVALTSEYPTVVLRSI